MVERFPSITLIGWTAFGAPSYRGVQWLRFRCRAEGAPPINAIKPTPRGFAASASLRSVGGTGNCTKMQFPPPPTAAYCTLR